MGCKKRIRKFLWALFILASFIGCIGFIRSSVSQFLEYEVVTTIKINALRKLTFPSVTFCGSINSTNRFDVKQIINCYFAGEESCFENFEQVIIYASGSYKYCSRFNGKKYSSNSRIFVSQNFGYRFGLNISLYLPAIQTTYINIADNQVEAVDGQFLTYLTGGSTSEISMNKVVQIALGHPYGNCIMRSELADFAKKHNNSIDFQRTANSDYTYLRANCRNYCFNRLYANECNCSLPGMNDLAGVKPCIKYSDCFNKYLQSFDYDVSCHCPTECEKNGFKTLKESANMPENDFHKLKAKAIEKGHDFTNKSDEYLKTEMLNLFIYYETMEQTVIDQSPQTTVSDLISNVGGTLGLFLGLSIISFVEIGQLIVDIIMIFIKRCSRKK